MPKLVVTSILFLTGVLLSALVVYFFDTSLDANSRGFPQPSLSSMSAARTIRSAVRRDFPRDEEESAREGSKDNTAATLRRNLDESALRARLEAGEGHDVLLKALESDYADMSPLRAEFVEKLSNYTTVILPLLKSRGVDHLLELFSESDWRNWPDARVVGSGEPTAARQFVDNVFERNAGLGSHLETAASLFHLLYESTSVGRPFDLSDGVKSLVVQRPGADARVNRGMFVTAMIVLDPNFVARIERERCRFVADRIGLDPSDLNSHLVLLPTLHADYCEPNVFRDVTAVLRTLAERGSPNLRFDVLDAEQRTRALDRFARLDDRVRDALAELYAIAAVDRLEMEQLQFARRYLGESVGLKPGLRSQTYLEEFFRRTSRPYDVLAEDSMDGNEVVVSGERSSGSGFLLYIIGALIGGIALLVVIFRIRARAEPTGFTVGDSSTSDDLLQSQIAPSTEEDVSSDKLVPMRVVKDRGRGARTARG